MKKRILSIALIFAMLAMFLPGAGLGLTAYAAEEEFVIQNGVLMGYNGSGGDVVVPEGVTKIHQNAFEYNTAITAVTLPDTVTMIDTDAFSGCTGLKRINLPDSLTQIGSSAFLGCRSLERITWPESVPIIDICVFSGCVSLKSFTIPKTVAKIESVAFWGCTGLTEITVPEGVQTIASDAFYQCASLKSIRVLSGNKAYCSQDGVLYTKDKSTLVTCPGARTGEFIIPNFVTTVAKRAFAYCKGITCVTVPASVTKMEGHAFYGCEGLQKVYILTREYSVAPGEFPFVLCDNVTDVYYMGTYRQWEELKYYTGLGSNVKYHYNYKHSTPLYIYSQPQSVVKEKGKTVTFDVGAEGEGKLTYQWYYRKIDDDSWSVWTGHTNAVERVTPNDSWDGIQLFCKIKDSAGNCLRSRVAMLILLDDDVIAEEPSGKCGDNLKWRLASDGTLTISGSGDMWDYYYDGLMFPPWVLSYVTYDFTADQIKNVAFSGSVTSIGDCAFALCKNLTSVTIPNTVKRIGDEAFAGTGITKITIPASVTDFGYDVFADAVLKVSSNTTIGCESKMTSITVGSGSKTYSSAGGVMFDKAKTELVCYPVAKQGAYTIPSTVQTVGAFAFSGCKGLTGVTIPASVKTVGVEAFAACTGLGSVTLPEGVTGIDDGAFLAAGLTGISIPKSVQSIGYLALNNTDAKGKEILPIADIYYAGSSLAWHRLATAGEFDDDFSFRDYLRGATIHFGDESAGIYRQPEDQMITIGDRLTVSLEAKGKGLTYQWYYKKAGQSTWNIWNNHTSPSETLTPGESWDGIRLFCEVTDADGVTVKSDIASITVKCPSINITRQPDDQTFVSGQPVTFSLAAQGSRLKTQWYYKKAGQTSWSKWNSRTHASETVTPNDTWDGMRIRCLLTDAAGQQVYSDEALFTMTKPAITITSQPVSQSVTLGDTIKLSVKAEGEGLSYQWYFKKAGQTGFTKWNNRTHATETVTPNATWDGIQLYCEIRDSAGGSVKSNTMTIKVTEPAIKITFQPVSQTVTLGDTIKLSVKAEGEGLTYQWYFKKAGQTGFTKWTGRTRATETVTPNATWDGIQLYCAIRDSAGGSVKSNTMTVTVTEPKIKITSQPVSRTVTLGDTIKLSVKAEGDGLTYQWYFKKAGQTSFTRWNGRNHSTETVTPNATWNGIQLYCAIRDSAGNGVRSETVTVTVQ